MTRTGAPAHGRITFGAMGDSFYEYLLKMWLYTGKREEQYRRMYLASADSMLAHMYGEQAGLAFVGELEGGGRLTHKMDHLACFLPGLLALGVLTE